MSKVAVRSNFSYIHPFTKGELCLIIDSLLFSSMIPTKWRKDLIKRIESLTSKYFSSRIGQIDSITHKELDYNEIFKNIEDIDEAITHSKKISFYYNNHKIEDNQVILESKKDGNGKIREYIINPYRMVASNGRYYVICNNNRFDNVSHYRIDRMTNIKILDERVRPQSEIKNLDKNFDLYSYMSKHIYMFGGEDIRVELLFKEEVLDVFIDWFGLSDARFSKDEDNFIRAKLVVNRTAIIKWALQYGLLVKIISPPDLVAEIREEISKIAEQYGGKI